MDKAADAMGVCVKTEIKKAKTTFNNATAAQLDAAFDKCDTKAQLAFEKAGGNKEDFAMMAVDAAVTKGANAMTLFAVTGGWEQHKGSPQAWRAVGTARFTEAKKQTRLVLDQPLRVEAGGRVGLHLHSPDTSGRGVQFHRGDMSPVQGEGLVIHKGMCTASVTPFEGVGTGENYFFVGSFEYARLG